MKTLTLFPILFLIVCSAVFGQRTCATMEVYERQLATDPERGNRLEALEKYTRVYRAPAGKQTAAVIPVVVHVLYHTAEENISTEQIESQLRVLNEDFRRLNPDRDDAWDQAADAGVEFCLASVDPDGKATDGIVRRATSVAAFVSDDRMKQEDKGGSAPWPAADYLNLWVCSLGEGILGYAQFPGGNPSTDGVVIDYRHFGTTGTAAPPYDRGRTATHEVGHYFNLRHIWGDGGCGAGDFVDDTPDSDRWHFGCAIGAVSCGTTDMVQNYMDYTDDACMNLFTAGQKDRMQAAISGARSTLLHSGGCGTPPEEEPCTDTEVVLTLVTDNYPTETSWTLDGPDGRVAAGGGYHTVQTITELFCLPAGCYTFTILDNFGDGICCAFGNGSYQITGADTLVAGAEFRDRDERSFCIGEDDDDRDLPCRNVELLADDFEMNYGNWNDGGIDCVRSKVRAVSGAVSIYLRDDSETSVLTSTPLRLTGFEELTVSFRYSTHSMEAGDEFWLQLDRDDGYETLARWSFGPDFVNGPVYDETVTVAGSFGSATRLRFLGKSSSDTDFVHLDDIVVNGCTRGSTRLAAARTDRRGYEVPEEEEEVTTPAVFPNPAGGEIFVRVAGAGARVSLREATGRGVLERTLEPGTTRLETGGLPRGMYFLVISGDNGERHVEKVLLK